MFMKIKPIFKHLTILFLILSIVISLLIGFLPNSTKAYAAGHYYYFYYASNPSATSNIINLNLSAMAILQCPVNNINKCESDIGVGNAEQTFLGSQNSGNSATFVYDQGGANQETITVDNICNPSSAILNNSGNKTISVNNYSSAVQHAIKNGDTYPVCDNSPQVNNQEIDVNVAFNNLPFGDLSQVGGQQNYLGPATLVLNQVAQQGAQPITTTTNQIVINGVGNSQNILFGKFKNIPPNNYSICLQNTNICKNVSKYPDFNHGPIEIQLSTSNQSIISSLVSAASNSPPPTCSNTGGPLSWITCSVINGIASLEQKLEKIIGSLLQTKTLNIIHGNTYAAWNDFRKFGNIVLLIALLAVIYAEVAGGGLFDAYTARKMLPRILAAAILLNLSIYIIAGLEDIINIVGYNIYNLLTFPFHAPPSIGVTTGTTTTKVALPTMTISGGEGVSFDLLGGVAATGGIWALVAGGGDAIGFLVLMVVVPALFAVLSVLLTIFLRQAILVVLAIVSPVAFALWSLPNTEQYFKKYTNLLFKTLLVYPIVMVIFALCDIGGTVMNNFKIEGSSSWVGPIMGIIAVVAPMFLVPFAFKISGGAIGQIQGALNNLSGKAVNKIKGDPKNPNSLQNRVKGRMRDRFSQAGISGANINERLGGFLPGRKNIYTREGRKKLAKAISDRKSAETSQHGQQYLESDAIWQDHKDDSKFTMAVANRDLATERMDKAKDAGNYAEASKWQDALDTASMMPSSRGVRMAAAQQWFASGYDLSEGGQEAYNEMAGTIADITGSIFNRSAAPGERIFTGKNANAAVSAMDKAQSSMPKNGRFELAGTNNATGYDPDKGIAKADPFTLGRAKPETVAAIGKSAQAHIATKNFKKASIYKKELRSIAQSSSGAVQARALEEFRELDADDELTKWEKKPTGQTKEIRQNFTADKKVLDPGFIGPPKPEEWTREEAARGFRYITVARTNNDDAADEARIARVPREDES